MDWGDWWLRSMGFSRQECWSGLPFPSPGDLPNPGIEPGSPTLQADTLPSEPPGKPITSIKCLAKKKTSKEPSFLYPSKVYVRSFLYLFYALKKQLHKNSEWSSLISGPGSKSSPPEVRNSSIAHGLQPATAFQREVLKQDHPVSLETSLPPRDCKEDIYPKILSPIVIYTFQRNPSDKYLSLFTGSIL